jgi:hypothetical protein
LLFSTREGKRRESGKTVWNNDGLEFFYTAERNWTEVYNSKEQFSVKRIIIQRVKLFKDQI